MMARLAELVSNPEGRLSTSDVIVVGGFLVSSLVVPDCCLESSGDRPDARGLSRRLVTHGSVARFTPDGAPVNREMLMTRLLALIKFILRPWWIVVLVAALAGGADYWRGTQQARLVAQATLATRQAECEARQRQQAQVTQQALKTALTRQQQLQGANDRLSA
ncbi:MAG: hypothetical protein ACR5LG_00145 [Sodalis sp. (in: enterobacteria)]|uniref:hypothetical protein n=1 Tax=Sodalis sp. (in: enterobacteria) TaxID=1898979 RepID=UPI003F305A9A